MDELLNEQIRNIIKTVIDRTMLDGISGDEMANESRDEIMTLMIKFAESCVPQKVDDFFGSNSSAGFNEAVDKMLENIRKGKGEK